MVQVEASGEQITLAFPVTDAAGRLNTSYSVLRRALVPKQEV
jgi:hypothetical protein